MTSSLRLAVTFVALALGACGFQLRGAANYAFESIYVGAPPTLPFTVELKRALAGAGSAKVVDAPTGAQVVLDIANISDDKAVLSLSPGGRAREFLLVKRVMFGLRGADGSVWLPQDTITVQRTYLYDDTERLAREIEAAAADRNAVGRDRADHAPAAGSQKA
jgi:LPS-assembly lipoprotein